MDAPMLSKTFVPYPLTTADLSSGTAEAHNIIAGLGDSDEKPSENATPNLVSYAGEEN